jgi:hypothetical protein
LTTTRGAPPSRTSLEGYYIYNILYNIYIYNILLYPWDNSEHFACACGRTATCASRSGTPATLRVSEASLLKCSHCLTATARLQRAFFSVCPSPSTRTLPGKASLVKDTRLDQESPSTAAACAPADVEIPNS